MLLDDELRPRGMTSAEMDEVQADRELMRTLAITVKSIYLVRAQRN